MAEERVQRRLAAILAADVVGFSRLMERDEAGTLAALKARRRDLQEPLVAKHQGRVFKTTGDGVLIEFASAVNAVQCAVELQQGMAAANGDQSEDWHIVLRIGVNLGDIMVEGGDLYGDGVNIAARLEALAEPGGILVSGTAYDHVGTKIKVGFEFQGERRVKNIDKPVRVYRVLANPATARTVIAATGDIKRWWRRPAVTAALLVLVVTAGVAAWLRLWEPRFEPNLPLPDKPSIAVMPFTNLSADPRQNYFADGMADDLITDLSRISGLFVIARNSAFAYKDKTINVRDVAQELGVRYVLQGSVQREGDQVRINAQLIDATTGGNRWAERYDGSLANIFAMQDKVTNAIVDALALRLTDSEQRELRQDETSVPAAYEAFLHGWELYRRTTPAGFTAAIPYFKEAIVLDPSYARAHAALALVYAQTYYFRWTYTLNMPRDEVRTLTRQYLAEAQKHPTPLTHHVAGILFQTEWQHAQAIAEFKEAIALDPGDPWNYAIMSAVLSSAGRPAEALPHIRTAMRLDPHYPAFFLYVLALAEFSLEDFKEAAISLEQATNLNPEGEYSFLLLAAAYGHLERPKDAAVALSRYNEAMVQRGSVPDTIATALPLDYSKYSDHNRLVEGYRLAGMPESPTSEQYISKKKLTTADLRELFLGHRLRGRNFATGEEHTASIAADGATTLAGDWGSFSDGKAEISDDQVCYVRSGGARFCGIVIRNPGGTRERENELIWIDARRPFTFSQVE